MTHTQLPEITAQPRPFLNERENQRAVDLIEQAERSEPYCPCGRHMIALGQGNEIWLECSSRTEERTGLSGFIARLTAFGHTRRMIMEVPAAN